MRNIRLILAYDGSAYAGWQRQSAHPSVQQTLEEALEKILNHPVKVLGASRTDAGAHAEAQVAHFHTERSIPLMGLQKALWSVLPEDIVVTKIEDAAPDFHARFNAKARTYRYDIWNEPVPNPFLAKRAYHVKELLKLAPMRRAARGIIGTHDFTSFCTQASEIPHAVRSVKNLSVTHEGAMVHVVITANGFVRGMIRTIVQTLVEVGLGRKPVGAPRAILAKKNRQAAPKAAPSHGLYLVKVAYGK